MGLDPELLRPLLHTPPPEFVAARNALVKQLRGEGRREEAAAVAALRRPSWVDWALDRVAGDDPALAGRFADAADAMRAAQREAVSGGAADVAGALRTLRDAQAAMARTASSVLRGAGRPGEIAELTERLTALAADEGRTAALRDAALAVADPDSTVDEVADVGAADPVRGTARPAVRPAREPTGRDAAGSDPAIDEVAAERRRETEMKQLRAEQREAERDLARLERAVGEAEHAHEVARATLERAQRELEASATRLGDVQRRRDEAARAIAERDDALQRIERDGLPKRPKR